MNTFSCLHTRLTLHASLRLNERQAFAGLTIRKDSHLREDTHAPPRAPQVFRRRGTTWPAAGVRQQHHQLPALVKLHAVSAAVWRGELRREHDGCPGRVGAEEGSVHVRLGHTRLVQQLVQVRDLSRPCSCGGAGKD
jgi:hypothetical protein